MTWELQFINAAKKALEEEENLIKELNEGRGNDRTSFYKGLLNSRRCESVIVYLILKKLLNTHYFDSWTINWEDTYDNGREHCDIMMTGKEDPGEGKVWKGWNYIEFGYYDDKKLEDEYKKLIQVKNKNKDHYCLGRYIVLFQNRTTNTNDKKLVDKIKSHSYYKEKVSWMYRGPSVSKRDVKFQNTKIKIKKKYLKWLF